MKKFIFIVLIALIWGCNGTGNSRFSPDSLKTDTIATMDTISPPSKNKGTSHSDNSKPWDFHEETNKMNDTKIFFADVTSTNELSLSPPYDGYNTGMIEVRKKDAANNVILTVDKGQIITGVEGGSIKVRFDQHPSEEYFCQRSSDFNPKVLFISSANRFISKLKKSKKVIIEVVMYQDGTQQLEFDTHGFKWDH